MSSKSTKDFELTKAHFKLTLQFEIYFELWGKIWNSTF